MEGLSDGEGPMRVTVDRALGSDDGAVVAAGGIALSMVVAESSPVLGLGARVRLPACARMPSSSYANAAEKPPSTAC